MTIFPKRPPRLTEIFDPSPIFFVTFNSSGRRPILANPAIHNSFVNYVLAGIDLGVSIGRYVIMPDHIHLFVALGPERTLGAAIGGLKRHLGRVAVQTNHELSRCDVWQDGFFDHLLRSNESYAEKWSYVRDNPVRAGLVARSEEWPFQGEIVILERS